jgi:hypothetical protein
MYMHDLFFESIMVVIITYVGNLVATIHDNYFQWHPICPFLNFSFACYIYNFHFGFDLLFVVVV